MDLLHGDGMPQPPDGLFLGPFVLIDLQLLAQLPGFLLGLPQRQLQPLGLTMRLRDLQLQLLGPPLGFQTLLALPPHVLQALPALPFQLLAQGLHRFRRGIAAAFAASPPSLRYVGSSPTGVV